MLTLIHLTDIHFGNKESVLSTRVSSLINAALCHVREDTTAVALVLNGDFANRGSTSEFVVAAEFINTLVKELKQSLGPEIDFCYFVTPGNHDCDFSSDQSMRDIALERIATERCPDSIERTVLEPLNNYFEFVSLLDHPPNAAIRSEAPYFVTYQIEVCSQYIDVMLGNSAWMSQRQEKANNAAFPLELLPKNPTENSTRSVFCMHHPYNWFRMPDTRTQLQQWVRANCDILFTGHEHIAGETKLNTADSQLLHVEGGALQQWDGDAASVFQVLRFEDGFARAQVACVEFDIDKQAYITSRDHIVEFGNVRSDRSFVSIKPEFRSWLEDPLLPISIANRGNLKLQDFFLYPDLNDYSNSISPEERTLVPSSRVEKRLLEATSALLTGDATCGKTALARHLFLAMRRESKIPLYLDAKKLDRDVSEKTVRSLVADALKRQYNDLTWEVLSQRPEDEVVILVDNFQLIYQQGHTPSAVVDQLRKFADRIVLFASEELIICESHAATEDFGAYADFEKFNICEFGQLRTEALAKKWICLANKNQDLAPEQIQQQVEKTTKQIQNVLSADVIPHQPWILIVLLQQAEDNDNVVLKNGSYGHMYQAIVTAALSRARLGAFDLPGQLAYLGALAFEIKASNQDAISQRRALDFHDAYCRRKDLNISFERLLDAFAECGVVKADAMGIRISSKYANCFFIAWHIHRHLHQEWAKDFVRECCTELYDSVSANTLLFLSHVSTDPFVLEAIKTAASSIFKTAPLATLTDDVEQLNRLGGTSDRVQIPSTTPEKNRHDLIAKRETKEEVRVSDDAQELTMVAIIDPETRDGRIKSQVHQIQAAYKMIRILGQVLKNEASAEDLDWKVSIVKEIFDLSRRMVGCGLAELADVDRWKEVAEVRLSDQVERHGRHENVKHRNGLTAPHVDDKLAIKAEREIIGICWLACFTIVKVVAEAVGAKNLTGTYAKVVDLDPSVPNRLFQLDVLMEHERDFPLEEATKLLRDVESNRFVTVLLKSLVAHQLYLYQRRQPQLQRISSRMKITIDGTKALNPNIKKERFGQPTMDRKQKRYGR
ncbi:Calcineurin-like phosphoesterase [Rosistilla oblonga]|uniref:metallophosphoesterase n=1 Tax=Rosistilla oblonga TaxID=2527990 RepID=UPI0011886B2F|nr:metallophosphoesterase [Rosistilla oblonga]QDV13233.1 Calcineurin-like phosphoesterase [Rosistilla oblonga]